MAADPAGSIVRRASTAELTTEEVRAIRSIMTAAFGDDEDERFTDDDWDHAIGGTHVVLELDGVIVAHASVVERALHVGEHDLRTGYVEAVGVAPGRQGRGLGSMVMHDVGEYIRERFELGALGTGRHSFYERLGWQRWRGPSFVRTAEADRPTPDDDGYILVFWTLATPPLDLTASIGCDWRPGDVW